MKNLLHKIIFTYGIIVIVHTGTIIAQAVLPVGFSTELQQLQRAGYQESLYSSQGIVRTMAQWEEIQALTIT